jgi:ketosteroid isomerase-like protein
MSQENVEVMQAAFAAWNAGDMDAMGELYDADIVVRAPEGWPEPGPFVGVEAVMRWLRQMRETWDSDVIETISLTDAGDRVVIRQRWRTVGRGPEANLEVTSVSTYRKGKVILVEFFWDHAEALEAVGLSEQDAHADS